MDTLKIAEMHLQTFTKHLYKSLCIYKDHIVYIMYIVSNIHVLLYY